MGVVYKARQVGLDRLVALKMILAGGHAGAEDRARFKAEAEAVARLQHPHIVQIHEVGEHNGLPFFSLELCSGGCLADKLDGTPLAAADAVRLVETLARAMQAAHQAGIVHRDLKPANVLLGAGGTAKITDFGLAKRLDQASGQTASGAVLGTPSYMAPEQAGAKRKEISPAADVYALGAILYESLTGRPPFKGVTALDTIRQVVQDEPVPVRRLQPKVPVDLEAVCHRCLEKEPQRRYASATDLAEDLQRWLGGQAVHARPLSNLHRVWRWCRRNRSSAAMLGLVALLLVGGTLVSSYFAFQAHAALQQKEAADRRGRETALRFIRFARQNPEVVRLSNREMVARFMANNPDLSDQDLTNGFDPDAPPPPATGAFAPSPPPGAAGSAGFNPNMFGD
jgi:serine/threonine protein kinase